MTRLLTLLALLACLASPAAAQTTPPVVGPSHVFTVDLEGGTMLNAAGQVVARPEANIAFDYRLGSNSTPVQAVKRQPCVVNDVASNRMSCFLSTPSALAAGPGAIAFRAKTNPTEPGIAPASDWSAAFAFSVVIVVPPGVPMNIRVQTLP